MNYLVHIYLSNDIEECILGNFIADHVKGQDLSTYSSGVQKGIKLHRFIDSYTDQHPLVKQSLKLLYPSLAKYSSIALDVFYDYLFIKNWEKYDNRDFREYINDIYFMLNSNRGVMPTTALRFLAYVNEYDIFYNYKSLVGMERVLKGLSKRARFTNSLHSSVELLVEHEDELSEKFILFFKDLRNNVKFSTM